MEQSAGKGHVPLLPRARMAVTTGHGGCRPWRLRIAWASSGPCQLPQVGSRASTSARAWTWGRNRPSLSLGRCAPTRRDVRVTIREPPCVVGPLKSYLCAHGTQSHGLPPALAVVAPCKMSVSRGCNTMTRQKSTQSDRWVEGHDPELFNLRRKTSKDDAMDSILLPPQNAGSGRGAPKSQAALPPQKDLPPHLLNQGTSHQVSSPISYCTPPSDKPCLINMTRASWAFHVSSLQEHPRDSV